MGVQSSSLVVSEASFFRARNQADASRIFADTCWMLFPAENEHNCRRLAGPRSHRARLSLLLRMEEQRRQR